MEIFFGTLIFLAVVAVVGHIIWVVAAFLIRAVFIGFEKPSYTGALEAELTDLFKRGKISQAAFHEVTAALNPNKRRPVVNRPFADEVIPPEKVAAAPAVASETPLPTAMEPVAAKVALPLEPVAPQVVTEIQREKVAYIPPAPTVLPIPVVESEALPPPLPVPQPVSIPVPLPAASLPPIPPPIPLPVAARHGLKDIFASFMEERNIRWGEMIGGMLIVLCSFALLLSFWKQINSVPLLRFGLFGALTGALFAAGFFLHRHWKLPQTGRGLLIIATLLVPLNAIGFSLFGGGPAWMGLAVGVPLLLVFSWLSRKAAQILAPPSADAAAAAVVLPALLQLAGSWLQQTPGVFFSLITAVYLVALWIGRVRILRARMPEPHGALFYLLGTASFSLFAAVLHLVIPQQSAADFLAGWSPFLVLWSLPALVTGLEILRHSERRAGVFMAASLTVVGGISLLLAGMLLAWPRPGSVLILSSMAFVAATVATRTGKQPWLHAPALVFLAIGVATAAALFDSHLTWDSNDADLYIAALDARIQFYALVGLFGVWIVVAEWFDRCRWRQSARIWRIGSAVLILPCTFLMRHWMGGKFPESLPELPLLVLAAGSLLLADRLRTRAFTWMGFVWIAILFHWTTNRFPEAWTNFHFSFAFVAAALVALGLSTLHRKPLGGSVPFIQRTLRDASTVSAWISVPFLLGETPGHWEMGAGIALLAAGFWWTLTRLKPSSASLVSAQLMTTCAIVLVSIGLFDATHPVDRICITAISFAGAAMGLILIEKIAPPGFRQASIFSRKKVPVVAVVLISFAALSTALVILGGFVVALAGRETNDVSLALAWGSLISTIGAGRLLRPRLRFSPVETVALLSSVPLLIAIPLLHPALVAVWLAAVLCVGFAALIRLRKPPSGAFVEGTILTYFVLQVGLLAATCLFKSDFPPVAHWLVALLAGGPFMLVAAAWFWRGAELKLPGFQMIAVLLANVAASTGWFAGENPEADFLQVNSLAAAIASLAWILYSRKFEKNQKTGLQTAHSWIATILITLACWLPSDPWWMTGLIVVAFAAPLLRYRLDGLLPESWLAGWVGCLVILSFERADQEIIWAFPALIVAISALVVLRKLGARGFTVTVTLLQIGGLVLHGRSAGQMDYLVANSIGALVILAAGFQLSRRVCAAIGCVLFHVTVNLYWGMVHGWSAAELLPLNLSLLAATGLVSSLFPHRGETYSRTISALVIIVASTMAVAALAEGSLIYSTPFLVVCALLPALFFLNLARNERQPQALPFLHFHGFLQIFLFGRVLFGESFSPILALYYAAYALVLETLLPGLILPWFPKSNRAAAARWSIPIHTIAILAISLLVPAFFIPFETEFPVLVTRICGALAIAIGAMVHWQISHRSESAAHRHFTYWTGVLAVIVSGWTLLPPMELLGGPMRIIAVSLLPATVALLGSAFLRSADEKWRGTLNFSRQLHAGICGATAIFLVLIEFGSFRSFATAPLQIGAAILLLAGLLLAAALLKLPPDPTPGEISGRVGLVYLSEFFFALLAIHLRLVQPQWFRGWLESSWPFLTIGVAFACAALGEWSQRARHPVLTGPMQNTGLYLPLIPMLGFWTIHPAGQSSSLLFLGGLFYALQAGWRRSFPLWIVASLAANSALWVLLSENAALSIWVHPQLWCIPTALCILAVVHFHRDRLPMAMVSAIRHTCLCVIYISSTADIFLSGLAREPWLPFVLALLSVAGVVCGIAFRARSFLYLGTVFLMVSLLTMIWHASSNLGWKWVWPAAGLALGLLIVTGVALLERKREKILKIFADLKEWSA